MTAFIRRAPVEDNTASERIHTVAATYGCKILQKFYNHTNTMRTCTDTMRSVNDTSGMQVHVAKKTVDYRAEVFLDQSEQYMS